MFALGIVSTLGYVIIEGFSWLNAVYMTVITLGTVGYGETQTLDGIGRIFTIGVIIIGFTTFVYAISVLTNMFVSQDVLVQMHRRRAKRMREELDRHVIVVGFGRVGQAVVRGLQEMGKECIVLDRNPEAEASIRAAGGVEVIGDATNPDDLRRAGIDRADALIAACDADSENLVVVLTARSTNADLRIVSRVNEAAWMERLKHAGADMVHSPYPSYGMSLAASAMSSAILDLHDLPLLGLGTEEIQVPTGSPIIGLTSPQILAAHPSVYVLGLRRGGNLQPWHAVDGSVLAGDVLVALGAPEYLRELADTASP
jgi:voltage-gated potassium channel